MAANGSMTSWARIAECDDNTYGSHPGNAFRGNALPRAPRRKISEEGKKQRDAENCTLQKAGERERKAEAAKVEWITAE